MLLSFFFFGLLLLELSFVSNIVAVYNQKRNDSIHSKTMLFAHDRFLFCFVFVFNLRALSYHIFSLFVSLLEIRGRGSPLPLSAIRCAPLLKHQGVHDHDLVSRISNSDFVSTMHCLKYIIL